MKTTQEFAALLGKAYATLGIRQKELAERLGISSSYLSEMKNGGKQASDELYGRIEAMVEEVTIRERREAESGIEELLQAGANAFTKELLRMMEAKQSHPLRVRGLKLRGTGCYHSTEESHPLRVRGLKRS